MLLINGVFTNYFERCFILLFLFLFLILHCWVMHVPVKSTCTSAKWYSWVITNHPSVASYFPLCIQYIIEFSHIPFVSDLIRQQRSWNFWSLTISMHKCHCNFHVFKFAMKILLVQSGLLSFQIHSFPLLDTLNSHPKVECHVTHFTL